MSDIEYSVITSDVVKSFDCIILVKSQLSGCLLTQITLSLDGIL